MKFRTLASAFALTCACLAAACSSTEKEPDWVTSEIVCPSETVLWEFLLLSLNRSGFPVGMDADPAERKIATGWKTSPKSGAPAASRC